MPTADPGHSLSVRRSEMLAGLAAAQATATVFAASFPTPGTGSATVAATAPDGRM